MEIIFRLLNGSDPNVTKDCWPCVHSKPPYYVGTITHAAVGDNNLTDILNRTDTDYQGCWWGHGPQSLTLGDIQGVGTCVLSKSYPLHRSFYFDNCNETFVISNLSYPPNQHLSPSPGTWCACTNSLTPCFRLDIFTWKEPELCVLTHVLPQVSWEGGCLHFADPLPWRKRAPGLAPVFLLLGLAGSTARGTSALVVGHQPHQSLSQETGEDLGTLEQNVNRLEESLNSSGKMVLQNRRGFDLIFLKQGGLCLALKEHVAFI